MNLWIIYEFTDYSQILVVLGLLWNGLADYEHFLKAVASGCRRHAAATRVATFINLQNIMSKPRGSEWNRCFPATLIVYSIICEWFVNNLWIHRLFTDSQIIHRLFTDSGDKVQSCDFQKKVWSCIKFSPRCVRTPGRSGKGFWRALFFSLDSFFQF